MKLSQAQLDAINHINGPALTLAVPGAGKTTVIIHRIANLINKGIDPENILSITFSKASSLDMTKRFIKTFPDISNNVSFSTIHSLAFKILRDFALKNNFGYTLIESKQSPVNKNILLSKIYKHLNNKSISEEKLENLNTNISYVKNMLISLKHLPDDFTDVEHFKEIFKTYELYKKEHNLIDFDDMLTMCLYILNTDKIILNKYQKKYTYIQVDEAQDTSKVQIEIVKLLALPENNLFIVADDDQSIYSFRGASPKELFKFNKHYPKSNTFYMEENYRSGENIVNISNKFISQNSLRYKKDIFTKNNFDDLFEIKKVNNLKNQYEYIIEDVLKDTNYKNTVILYRNNLSAIGIIDYLDRNNIPFSNNDKRFKFFNHFIIRDIINFLSLAESPNDIFIFEKICFKMKGYISRKQLNAIKTMDYKTSVFERLFKLPDINSFYKNNFLELDNNFEFLNKLNFKQAVSFIENELEYKEYLRSFAQRTGQNYGNFKSILEIIKIIGNNSSDKNDFISRLQHLKNISKKDEEGITLSTLHSSKGLEFENVYIIDMFDGMFPSNKCLEKFLSKEDEASYEEERRLMYVGMTRAKKKLILITSNEKLLRYSPSNFIYEIEDSF